MFNIQNEKLSPKTGVSVSVTCSYMWRQMIRTIEGQHHMCLIMLVENIQVIWKNNSNHLLKLKATPLVDVTPYPILS